MKILHLVSCQGWSSDAYWAARMAVELRRRGHDVTLGFRTGTEARVIDRARTLGVERIVTFAFTGGVRPVADVDDIRRLAAAIRDVDVVHVHRGKEHWLAAVANRLAATPRPLVRTRHIVHPVQPHAGNRWLYGRATSLVTTVSEAIRRQYLVSGLIAPERVVTLRGGADALLFQPGPADPETRRRLGAVDGMPLVGIVSGLRVMKGHGVVAEAARRLRDSGLAARYVFAGTGRSEAMVRDAIGRAGVESAVTITGFERDLPAVMRALDVALYPPLESDGMSRVVFEYLAAGAPLVASRVGVVPEILADREHALTVPGGDPAALADAIRSLLTDRGLAARLAAAGRRLVDEKYSGARVAEALEHHYARLGAGRAARATA